MTPSAFLIAFISALLGGAVVYTMDRQRMARLERKVERWGKLASRLVKESRASGSSLQGIPTTKDNPEELEVLYNNLLQDERRLKAVLEAMSEGLALLRADGTVLYSNPAFGTTFQLDAARRISPESFELNSREHFASALTVVRDTRKVSTAELLLRTTPARDILVTMTPYSDSAIAEGIILTSFDVTDRKRAEQLRSEFVANVSHELRTPLAAIRGYVETCIDSRADEEEPPYERFLPIIHQHTLRLSALIEDLLILSRIESQGMQLKIAPLPLSVPVEAAITTLTPHADKKRVTLVNALPPMLPDVYIDQSATERILINLIENAIKYSEDNSEVLVTARLQTDEIVVSVVDQGLGISKEDQARIFERFYRVDKARSRKAGGTGLGLSIVKHLVQAQGGEVWVDSSPGRGSKFSLTVPLVPQLEIRTPRPLGQSR